MQDVKRDDLIGLVWMSARLQRSIGGGLEDAFVRLSSEAPNTASGSSRSTSSAFQYTHGIDMDIDIDEEDMTTTTQTTSRPTSARPILRVPTFTRRWTPL